MVRGLLWVALGPSLVNPTHSHPVNTTPDRLFYTPKTEKSWLWGWAWGAESRVSVLDHAPILSFPSRPAAFGAEITDPILGYIIPLSSFTVPCAREESMAYPPSNPGCPDLCISGPNKPSETWIALVQRGQCEFVKKVREAQRLGARAVVVGGDDPLTSGYPDTLVNMYSPEDASDVSIAATYIKYSDYLQLSSLIATSKTSHSGLKTLSLLITAEYSAWEWYSPIITFIIILLLPSALTFITLLIHRLRAARAAQRDRAPEDVVRNLPWYVWGAKWEKREGENENSNPTSSDTDLAETDAVSRALLNEVPDDDVPNGASTSAKAPGEQPWFEQQVECAICLSEFEKGDKVRVLPCHHIFHLDEVDEWLIQRKKLCPVCKSDVTQTPMPIPNESYPSNLEPPTERTPLLTDDTSRHL